MADQQPDDEKAMADQQQPDDDKAMVVVDQQPQGEAEVRYLVKEVEEADALLKFITARLEAAPGVGDEVVSLFVGLWRGQGDDRAVDARLSELLQGYPDVLHRIAAFAGGAKDPVPVASLALSRPRRITTTRRTERDSHCLSVPAEETHLPGGGAQEYRSPRKSKKERVRRPEPAAAVAAVQTRVDDPRLAEASAFLERVGKIAGVDVLDKLHNVLDDADHDVDMLADVIYIRAGEALGPGHAALLDEFAHRFLPGEEEREEQQARPVAPKCKRAAAKDDVGAPSSKSTGRKARAGDGGHRQDAQRIGESSGGGTAACSQFTLYHATVHIGNKKRHADDDNHRGHGIERIGEQSGGGVFHSNGDNHAPRIRFKKPRADDDDGGHRRHAPSNGGEPSGSVAAARVLNGSVVHANGNGVKKKSRRRAPNGAEAAGPSAVPPPPAPGPESDEKNAALYRQFRKLWEFYTHYSTLVETMRRAESLLERDGDGDGDGLPTSLEEQFPERRHREYLSVYYGERWGEMKAKLEGGRSTRAALRVVLAMLRRKEDEAVEEEARNRRLHDAPRVAERLYVLAMAAVRQAEHRRKDARGPGGASGKRACPRR